MAKLACDQVHHKATALGVGSSVSVVLFVLFLRIGFEYSASPGVAEAMLPQHGDVLRAVRLLRAARGSYLWGAVVVNAVLMFYTAE